MAHDVFIANSPEDKTIADTICTALESEGIKCWLASRNIRKGQDHNKAVKKAIISGKIMIIVFSKHSNKATNLAGEMNIALNANLNIIPLRLDQVEPKGVMQYYLADTHWFDLSKPPTGEQLKSLVKTIKLSLISIKESVKNSPRRKQRTEKNPLSRSAVIATTTLTALSCGILIYGAVLITASLLHLAEALFSLIGAF